MRNRKLKSAEAAFAEAQSMWRTELARAVAKERTTALAVAERVFDEHPQTRDRLHDPGCLCVAIGRGECAKCERGIAMLAALRAHSQTL